MRSPVSVRSGLGLDPGETEAISLALEWNIQAILMDERRGRLAAEKNGVSMIGTLNILEAAHYRGFLNFEDAISRLRHTSFRASDALLSALLERVGGHNGGPNDWIH